jgi:hypothetical protein
MQNGGSASVSVICVGGAKREAVNEHQRTNPAQYLPGFWKPIGPGLTLILAGRVSGSNRG